MDEGEHADPYVGVLGSQETCRVGFDYVTEISTDGADAEPEVTWVAVGEDRLEEFDGEVEGRFGDEGGRRRGCRGGRGGRGV